MDKSRAKRLAGRALMAFLTLMAGCTESTWWDAQGTYTGQVTLPGAAQQLGTGSLSDPVAGQNEERVDLCVLTAMDVGLGFVPIQKDRPAVIQVRTDRPLCQEGTTQITGGAVSIWAHPNGDPNVLAAVRSDAWTVTGEIRVDRYTSQALPDLAVGEHAETEHIEGTLSLTATDPSGAVIRITGATFQLTATASRVKIDFS